MFSKEACRWLYHCCGITTDSYGDIAGSTSYGCVATSLVEMRMEWPASLRGEFKRFVSYYYRS